MRKIRKESEEDEWMKGDNRQAKVAGKTQRGERRLFWVQKYSWG